MRRIDIVKRDRRWIGEDGDGNVVVDEPSKAEALDAVRSQGTDDDPVTVKVHLTDGTFEEERTYPRAVDPQRSAG